MRLGLHLDARAQRARDAFVAFLGPDAQATRQAWIDTLPRVEWKGKTLMTIRCHGTTGRGPHDLNVPEALLWALMDPSRFRCPHHAGSETMIDVFTSETSEQAERIP